MTLGTSKTFFVVEAAADVCESHDLVARFLHQFRSHGAYVAEALNNDAATFLLDAQFWPALLSQQIITPRPVASFLPRESAELDGFAGDDRRGWPGRGAWRTCP